MGGQVAGRGGRKRRLNADINVVPYIDVMLVLLVIFMVTAPLLTQGIDVQLPQTTSQALPPNDDNITLFVDSKGQYFLDIGEHARDKEDMGKHPLADDEVSEDIAKVLRNKPDAMVLLKADQSVPYAAVAKGMALLQAGGAAKIGFVTDAPDAGSGKKRPHG